MVSAAEIADGLRQLGLDRSSSVIVHSSLKSFGYVDGGAEAVCDALTDTCGTVLAPAGTWDFTGIGPPPGTARPHNAYDPAPTWEAFDEELTRATAFSPDLPIDRELGRIPETLRLTRTPARTAHPLFSYIAVGPAADQLLAAQRPDWPLGPIEELGGLNGDVLLLGVDHTTNTTIHLAEQLLGRSRFYRYAKTADRVWSEFPNIPGDSHEFDTIEPTLRSATRETTISNCRARKIPVTAVLAATRQLVLADPAALLCTTPTCRCAAAHQQRLAVL
ncbi:aminoglycoside 3-N-acetyltransferase [Kribbella steppae]|uniref:Aminoglycoside N(3)-acetyltransferase n=1 Tax=Kribbella steppae TaxID=2512223 RepID=A0A4R2HTB2_9ACTN|nr:AAC(3) family N-acetyltransferase [Kribbella steppae]TCO34554.1 aminoglycoside 3-N-acetyltransferase [Kribbella steppae]